MAFVKPSRDGESYLVVRDGISASDADWMSTLDYDAVVAAGALTIPYHYATEKLIVIAEQYTDPNSDTLVADSGTTFDLTPVILNPKTNCPYAPTATTGVAPYVPQVIDDFDNGIIGFRVSNLVFGGAADRLRLVCCLLRN